MLDVIPLSLGTNVKNNYKEQKVQDEGEIMDVIIKRGTYFPVNAKKTYRTTFDNQTEMMIDIYEGENNFVKYNHLLKKSTITGLTERPKGETRVDVAFDININGILTVKAEEQSENNTGQKMELTIKDDDISLNPKKIEELKKKNKKILEKMNKNDSSNKDYNNLEGKLKEYNDNYKKCNENKENDDDVNVSIYKMNYNNALEEFIDSFGKTFDNEILFEEFYSYVKKLFLSYFKL